MRMALQKKLAEAGGRSPGSREEAAAYIAELTGDLAMIAHRHGLDALGYILDMATMEARNNVRKLNNSSS